MIQQIYQEIERSNGVILFKELAKKIDLDESTLFGILRTMKRDRLQSHLQTNQTLICNSKSCAGCPLASTRCSGRSGYRTVMRIDKR